MSQPGRLVKPAPRVHSGKGSTQRRAEGEAMLADQIRGMRMSQLCEKYGVSHATISRRLKAALDERTPVTADARREQLNASLDEQLAKWQKQLEAGEALRDRGGITADLAMAALGLTTIKDALAGIARVDERRAKLNGTDAVVRQEVEVVSVTPQEKRLQQLLAAAQAASAEHEQQLIDDDSED